MTDELQTRIRSGVLEAPTWDIIRGAKLAAKMYAPLGTLMPLGEYVRLSHQFSDAFTGPTKADSLTADQESVLKLCKDLNVGFHSCVLHKVLKNDAGLSRQTLSFGSQRRSNSQVTSPTNNRTANGCQTDLVLHPLPCLPSGPRSLGAGFCYHLHGGSKVLDERRASV